VLITGETGTGKDLCARAIHHLSERRSRPFIPVDCGALPDHLFENELFGHARGAFTDAHLDQKGLVALAEGGTLFLDEVDALSHATQTKLLRFLQDRSYKPLGAERFLRADVNVIAASNRDLSELVAQHRFRSDLFFRLNVVNLHLSPLRERKGDIPLLAEHFVKAVCAEKGVQRKSLTASTLRVLGSHSWPGNVRELYNVIQRAVLLGQGHQVLPSDVAIRSAQRPEAASSSFREARAQAIEAFEKAYVEDLLNRHAGNVTRAAREARKDRRAFGRLIKKLNIARVP
jgi:two-component system response regulator GlrR